MEDIVKIVKPLQDSGLRVSKTVQNDVKEQRRGFLSMLLGTWSVSLLGNKLLVGKGMNRAGEAFIRAGYRSKIKKN